LVVLSASDDSSALIPPRINFGTPADVERALISVRRIEYIK